MDADEWEPIQKRLQDNCRNRGAERLVITRYDGWRYVLATDHIGGRSVVMEPVGKAWGLVEGMTTLPGLAERYAISASWGWDPKNPLTPPRLAVPERDRERWERAQAEEEELWAERRADFSTTSDFDPEPDTEPDAQQDADPEPGTSKRFYFLGMTARDIYAEIGVAAGFAGVRGRKLAEVLETNLWVKRLREAIKTISG
jgi:hypothetical protein